MLRYCLALFAFVITFAAPPVMAEEKSVGDIILETVFEETEKTIIEEYFGKKKDADQDQKGKGKSKNKHKDKKKGKPAHAKGKALPPGLQKQLDEKGRLPPGLEGKELPPGLAERLPAPRKGTKRIIVDNDVVLIEEATRKVLDVITDVLSTE